MKSKKRKMTARDLLKQKFVGSVVMSPDESRVMFTASVISTDQKKYFSHIYMVDVDSGNLRQYTFGEVVDSGPVFSPDGKWIVFTSKRGEKKGIYRMPTEGGEAKLLVDDDGSYSYLSVSPDSSKIMCVFTRADEASKDKDGKKEQPVYRHITRLWYRFDGSGFLPGDRGHVFIYDILTGKGKQIGRMKNGEVSPAWFPNSSQIAFVSNINRDPDRNTARDDIFVVSLKGGKPRRLSKPAGWAEGLSVSPDGKHVAYIAHDAEGSWSDSKIHLWKVPVRGGKAADLMPNVDRPAFDLTISDTIGLWDWNSIAPRWSPDGRRLFFLLTDTGATYLCSVSASGGNLRRVIGGKLHVSKFSLAGSSRRAAALISTPTMPAEVHVANTSGTGKPKRLTSLNSAIAKDVHLQKPEEVLVQGEDNNAIHGWILKPPRFSSKRKYPSIMQIHGGPVVQYGYTYFHEMQYLAAQGYVVYYCNPRGGQGYGIEHSSAIVGKWGTVDYDDCMSMANYMAAQKYIDVRKMGVTGGSYGGFMTNWIVTHTNRFAAAVTQRSVTNMISFFGSSDLGYMFEKTLKAVPYTDHDRLWQMSPIKHVRKIKTPLLIIHSESDLRCPIEQGEQLFVALKMLRRKVEMLRFPEEPHGLSRNGRPDRRIVRLEWILKWFDRYLRGKS